MERRKTPELARLRTPATLLRPTWIPNKIVKDLRHWAVTGADVPRS